MRTANPILTNPTPESIFTPAMAAWSSQSPLGALSLATMPKWAGYAVAAAALFAAYKRKVPMWAGLAGAGAAYWFLIRAGSAGGNSITAGTVNVSDGTSYALTAASPGILSADGSTLTIAGTVYPIISSVPLGDGTTSYIVNTPVTATG